eukprot:Opistho-2@76080
MNEGDFRELFNAKPDDSDSDGDDPTQLAEKLRGGGLLSSGQAQDASASNASIAYDAEYDLMLDALQRQLEFVEKRLGEFLGAGNDLSSAGAAGLLRDAQEADAALRRALRGARGKDSQPQTAMPSLLGKYLPRQAAERGAKKSKYVNHDFIDRIKKRENEKLARARDSSDEDDYGNNDEDYPRHHRRDGEQVRLQQAESVLGTYETCKTLLKSMRKDELQEKLSRQRKEEQRRRERKEKKERALEADATAKRYARKLPRSTLSKEEDGFIAALPKTKYYELAQLEMAMIRGGHDAKQLWEEQVPSGGARGQLVIYQKGHPGGHAVATAGTAAAAANNASMSHLRNHKGDEFSGRRPLPDIVVNAGVTASSRAQSPGSPHVDGSLTTAANTTVALGDASGVDGNTLTAGVHSARLSEREVGSRMAGEKEKLKTEATILPSLPSLERSLGGNAERVVQELLPLFKRDEPSDTKEPEKGAAPTHAGELKRKRIHREEERARFTQMYATAKSNRERALKLLETNPPLEMIMGAGGRSSARPRGSILGSKIGTPTVPDNDFSLEYDGVGNRGRIASLVPSHLLITDAEKLVEGDPVEEYGSLWEKKKRALSGFDFDDARSEGTRTYGRGFSSLSIQSDPYTIEDGASVSSAAENYQALVPYGGAGGAGAGRIAEEDDGDGVLSAPSDVPRIEAGPVIVPLTMGTLLETEHLPIKKATIPPRMWKVI